jgi:5-methyltetrahydrofolate--homocysteine methyltransferase
MEQQMSILDQITSAVVECDEETTPKLVEQALAEGIPPVKILQEGLLAGMTRVGELFRDGEYFVPEMLIAAEAMKAAMVILKPHLVSAGIKPEGTAVVGTVQGDLHDIGKNLVATMLGGAGFEVIDLGVDVAPQTFVDACREHQADLVGLSALLTTTMPMMEATVNAIQNASLDKKPIILIGGAPVTDDYASKIGADGYARDAATGAELAKTKCFS